MKAEEARKIAESKNKKQFKSTLDRILEQIEESANKGNFKISYYGGIPKDVEEYLVNLLKYNVNQIQVEYNSSETIISW